MVERVPLDPCQEGTSSEDKGVDVAPVRSSKKMNLNPDPLKVVPAGVRQVWTATEDSSMRRCRRCGFFSELRWFDLVIEDGKRYWECASTKACERRRCGAVRQIKADAGMTVLAPTGLLEQGEVEELQRWGITTVEELAGSIEADPASMAKILHKSKADLGSLREQAEKLISPQMRDAIERGRGRKYPLGERLGEVSDDS